MKLTYKELKLLADNQAEIKGNEIDYKIYNHNCYVRVEMIFDGKKAIFNYSPIDDGFMTEEVHAMVHGKPIEKYIVEYVELVPGEEDERLFQEALNKCRQADINV